jgi:DNA processing protein
MSELIIKKLAIGLLPGVGNASAQYLISDLQAMEDIFTKQQCEVKWESGVRKMTFKLEDVSEALKQAEYKWKVYEQEGVKVVFHNDSDYPRRLRFCADAPYRFFYKGNINWNVPRTVGVIGTRRATSYGIHQTEKLIEELEPYNVTLISGLAFGIDAAAHKMALKKNIQNIGVLGCGLKKIYPAEHHTLAKKMQDNGGLISEYFADTLPDRENFPERNRIVAGLCDAIIVVETASKGGALITADIAQSYSRDVFAYPGRVGDVQSEGCLNYIKYNKAALVTSAADVAWYMQWKKAEESQKPVQRQLFAELNETEQKLIAIIENQKTADIDAIAYETGISVSQASAELLNLEFKGIVKSLPGKRYMMI